MADDDQKKTESSAGSEKADDKLSQADYQDIFNKGFKTAEQKLKQKLDDVNSQLEELKNFKQEKDKEAEQMKNKELEEKQQWEEVKKNLTDSFQKKEETFRKQIDDLGGRLRSQVIDSELYKWAAKKDVVSEATDDFVLAVSRCMGYKADDENGVTKFKIFPQADGAPMINTKTGDELSVEAFIDDFLEKKPFYRASKAEGGSGGKGSSGLTGKSISTSAEAIHVGLQKLMKGK